MAIIKNLQWIIIESDSQLTINAIHGKIVAQRAIINLVEDIRNMCNLLRKLAIGIVIEFVIGRLIEWQRVHIVN